jgi:hypothetical protein
LTRSDSLYLQAETLQELKSWINVIAAAKYSPFNSAPLPIEPIASDDEDEEGEELTCETTVDQPLENLLPLPQLPSSDLSFQKIFSESGVELVKLEADPEYICVLIKGSSFIKIKFLKDEILICTICLNLFPYPIIWYSISHQHYRRI